MAATQVRNAKTILTEGSSIPTTNYPREDMEEFLKAYESELDVESFVVGFVKRNRCNVLNGNIFSLWLDAL